MSAQLLLIRHGQPLNRCAGGPERMSGWTDFPLSSEGCRQAALLAQKLEDEHIRFDALYSSPLQRAVDTARAISSRCATPLVLVDELREIGCGCVDGLPIPDVQRDFSKYWQANLRQNDEAFRWPGGESYRELRERCVKAVSTLAARHASQLIAIVTHAGVISQTSHLRFNPAPRSNRRATRKPLAQVRHKDPGEPAPVRSAATAGCSEL